MFDEKFFKTSVQQHHKEKSCESPEQASLIVQLHTGQEYKISRILEVEANWVVLEVYPPHGKEPRKYSSESRSSNVPLYDLDRIAVHYGNIALVIVTLEPKSENLGFRS